MKKKKRTKEDHDLIRAAKAFERAQLSKLRQSDGNDESQRNRKSK